MSAALSCVLAIDEGVVFFSSLFGMGKSNFNILARGEQPGSVHLLR